MRMLSLAFGLFTGLAVQAAVTAAAAQEVLPWERKSQHSGNNPNNDYAPRSTDQAGRQVPNSYGNRTYEPSGSRSNDYGRPQNGSDRDYNAPRRYAAPRQPEPRYSEPRRSEPRYSEPRYRSREPYPQARHAPPPVRDHRSTYSESEIINAGHSFFGSLSKGLAKAIEYAFRSQGRPNGYILGEDASGAFIAGLRYGEGRLHTKYGRSRRVYWQGPSIGYDFGGEGTRTMVLVYNLRGPRDVFRRFAGVQGSAYFIGGASVQLLKNNDVTLAPIRTGVGLRLGANIGYLKYTRRPTWNPF